MWLLKSIKTILCNERGYLGAAVALAALVAGLYSSNESSKKADKQNKISAAASMDLGAGEVGGSTTQSSVKTDYSSTEYKNFLQQFYT